MEKAKKPIYNLPANIGKAVDYVIGKRGEIKINPRLFLEKYSGFIQEKGKALQEEVKNFCGKNKRLSIPLSFFDKDLYSQYFMRHETVARSFPCRREFRGRVVWRLVVGLGAASVYETSISLHRNYSIPLIPGSALKGVARSWAFYEEKRTLELDEAETKKLAEEFRLRDDDARFLLGRSESYEDTVEKLEIFGSLGQEGKIVFLDSLPEPNSLNSDFLVLDILNVHYPDYYRDKEAKTPPGDWMSPVPVFFLAVEGITYRFWLMVKDEEELRLLERAESLLKGALENIGVGAKTSAGYGYLKIL